MKVLYVYMFPLWGNGSGNWLRRLIVSMNENYPRSFEAAIIAPEKRKIKFSKIYRLKPPHLGVFVGNPELPHEKKYAQFTNREMVEVYNYYMYHTARAIEDFKPDLIHVFHTAFLPAFIRPLSNLYKVPYMVTTHGSDLYYFKEDSRWLASARTGVEKAKYVTANSNFTKAWFLQMFPTIKAKKTKIIPAGVSNGTDFERDVSWIDKKYKFKHERVVLFTGRLTMHKGVEYLIKAARQINAEILILGDGPERKSIEKLIEQYKLKNVHMLGYFSEKVEQINDFYLRADVYVAPSVWNEPLGLVILEAMAQKTPVVVTRKGGVSTVVKDGYNGYLVRARSPKEIIEKVNHLLGNDNLRHKMGDNAYKTVVERFNWDKIAGKFYYLYTKS
ncbi:MAG: glycosyltransferase family 4 protein, partial [Bacteriovoracales bacterium]